MTTDYKPLTPEQMEEALSKYDLNAGSGWLQKNDWLYKTLQVIEQAAIENYLAQHPEPQDAQVGKDAERYRQARTMPLVIDNSRIAPRRPDKFDTMIDAAIAAAKGK